MTKTTDSKPEEKVPDMLDMLLRPLTGSEKLEQPVREFRLAYLNIKDELTARYGEDEACYRLGLFLKDITQTLSDRTFVLGHIQALVHLDNGKFPDIDIKDLNV